jgi:hypothetical protein
MIESGTLRLGGRPNIEFGIHKPTYLEFESKVRDDI